MLSASVLLRGPVRRALLVRFGKHANIATLMRKMSTIGVGGRLGKQNFEIKSHPLTSSSVSGRGGKKSSSSWKTSNWDMSSWNELGAVNTLELFVLDMLVLVVAAFLFDELGGISV